jgi:hypothetical protein
MAVAGTIKQQKSGLTGWPVSVSLEIGNGQQSLPQNVERLSATEPLFLLRQMARENAGPNQLNDLHFPALTRGRPLLFSHAPVFAPVTIDLYL